MCHKIEKTDSLYNKVHTQKEINPQKQAELTDKKADK